MSAGDLSTNASLHADQARRQVGKAGLHLAARPLLSQHNGTTLIVANDVEQVLAVSIPITAIAVLSVWTWRQAVCGAGVAKPDLGRL